MPGFRTPANPQDLNNSLNGTSVRQAGAQVPPTDKADGGQFAHGEGTQENAYQEKAKETH